MARLRGGERTERARIVLIALLLGGCATETEVRIREPQRVSIAGSCPRPTKTIALRGAAYPDPSGGRITLPCASEANSDRVSGELTIPLDNVEEIVAHENPPRIGLAVSSFFGAAVLSVIAGLAAPQVTNHKMGAGSDFGRSAMLGLEFALAGGFLAAGIWELWPATDRVIFSAGADRATGGL